MISDLHMLFTWWSSRMEADPTNPLTPNLLFVSNMELMSTSNIILKRKLAINNPIGFTKKNHVS